MPAGFRRCSHCSLNPVYLCCRGALPVLLPLPPGKVAFACNPTCGWWRGHSLILLVQPESYTGCVCLGLSVMLSQCSFHSPVWQGDCAVCRWFGFGSKFPAFLPAVADLCFMSFQRPGPALYLPVADVLASPLL